MFLTKERVKWINWASEKGNEDKCSCVAGLHIVSALAEAMEMEVELIKTQKKVSKNE